MGKGAAFDECACYTTRRAARQLGQAYDRALRPSGLTNTQFSTLAVISLSEGSAGIDLTMSELAARIGVERTTLTRNLEVMRRDGLVRVMAGADARLAVISLSEGSAGIDLTMSELAARIGVERTTLTRNLEVMRRDGLVRVMAGADARCKRIELTAKGRAALQKAVPLWRGVQAEVTASVGDWPRVRRDIANLGQAAEACR
ncbi:transcriptional repressor [Mycobacterium tuberculosis variant bovis B2 7505]|nr:transcriptional repressor [Mycobacterium tuberculosis variant bovis B2 7505]